MLELRAAETAAASAAEEDPLAAAKKKSAQALTYFAGDGLAGGSSKISASGGAARRASSRACGGGAEPGAGAHKEGEGASQEDGMQIMLCVSFVPIRFAYVARRDIGNARRRAGKGEEKARDPCGGKGRVSGQSEQVGAGGGREGGEGGGGGRAAGKGQTGGQTREARMERKRKRTGRRSAGREEEREGRKGGRPLSTLPLNWLCCTGGGGDGEFDDEFDYAFDGEARQASKTSFLSNLPTLSPFSLSARGVAPSSFPSSSDKPSPSGPLLSILSPGRDTQASL